MVRVWNSRSGTASHRSVRPHYARRYTHNASHGIAARRIQAAWRARAARRRPQYSNTKSVRSVNKPNQSRFKGRNMVADHKRLSRFNYKMLKGLTGSGILEKRLISHTKVNYDSPSLVATLNNNLRSMSGYLINYSTTDGNAEDIAATTGIPAGPIAQAFQISGTTSQDRYVYYKNFRTEVTLTTEASSFAGVPDPTNAAQLGYVNQLNFRVLFLKRKPGLKTGQISTPASINEPTLANSLFLGYNNVPYGLTREYGQVATSIVGQSAPIDVMLGKINHAQWQVLQDKQFPLSVPVANVAGAESKYPNMKKLIFSHPINEKVLVSTNSTGTFPMDWNDKYMCVILAGLPNSSNAVLAGSTGLVPVTNRLWKCSLRGFTSYLDA